MASDSPELSVVERVARVHYFGSGPFDQAIWDGDEFGRKTSIEMAKLEIAAMREPTEKMIKAAKGSAPFAPAMYHYIFTSMIDEALK